MSFDFLIIKIIYSYFWKLLLKCMSIEVYSEAFFIVWLKLLADMKS